jgi:thioredoxin 1
MNTSQCILTIAFVCCSALSASCQENGREKSVEQIKSPMVEQVKVTFVELGSVNCIPCKAMQPIMRDIEKEYTGQVKVVFYDVWTEAGQPYGDFYKIRAIPTQIFLDQDGKEYFRHEGYFPKEELVKILKQNGVR